MEPKVIILKDQAGKFQVAHDGVATMTHFVVSGQSQSNIKKYNKWDCIELFSTIIDIY
jgi:hypothetical protein